MTNPNETAYPLIVEGTTDINQLGLTKLELFSAMILQGFLATKGSYFPDNQNTGELAAIASVKYAKALIEALNKEGK